MWHAYRTSRIFRIKVHAKFSDKQHCTTLSLILRIYFCAFYFHVSQAVRKYFNNRDLRYQESNKVTIVFYMCITNEEPMIACSLYGITCIRTFAAIAFLYVCKLKLIKFCNSASSDKAGFINFSKLVWGMKSPNIIQGWVFWGGGRGIWKVYTSLTKTFWG